MAQVSRLSRAKSTPSDRLESGSFSRAAPFSLALTRHNLKLERDKTTTLQVNTGLLCNQACRHCHLSAGPNRMEIMRPDTIDAVVDYAAAVRFDTIDITGGAPELNPHITDLIERMAPLSSTLMFRSNLSALNDGNHDALMTLLTGHRAVIVASFPTINAAQTDSQRGNGIFDVSIDALQKLNALGYGREGSGLELNLVSNPTGAFLPSSQEQTEKRFRQVLKDKWDIDFSNLFSFANVPLGRFRQWLRQSNNLDMYLEKLAGHFNPCSVAGVMCRSLVSVSWDGYLFDCDFNLAAGIYMGGRKIHVSEMEGPPREGTPIATADHCYTCTAGSGFT
ncbi:MAG: DUF3641 domain-containing protein [Deltaproteobacteria bacterium]|nr:MAG: DUF3641 domain-containing protein [Deltaproteobacteria bacterium]